MSDFLFESAAAQDAPVTYEEGVPLTLDPLTAGEDGTSEEANSTVSSVEAAILAQAEGEQPRDPKTGQFLAPEDAGAPNEDEGDGEELEDGEDEELEDEGGEDGELEDEGGEDESGPVTVGGRTYKSASAAFEAFDKTISKLGEMGNELGELRKVRSEMDELRSELAAERQAKQLEESWLPVDDSSRQQADNVWQQAGPSAAATWALQNCPGLYLEIHDAWAMSEPGPAQRFHEARMRELEQAEREQSPSNAPSKATSQPAEADYTLAWNQLVESDAKLADALVAGHDSMTAFLKDPSEQDVIEALKLTLPPERFLLKVLELSQGKHATALAETKTQVALSEQERNRAAKRKGRVGSTKSGGTSVRRPASFQEQTIAELQQVDPVRAGFDAFRNGK